MSKMRAFLIGATAAGALAAGSLIPAQAVEQEVGPVTIEADGDASGGHITVSGDEGYLTISGDSSGNVDVCGESVTAEQAGCVIADNT